MLNKVEDSMIKQDSITYFPCVQVKSNADIKDQEAPAALLGVSHYTDPAQSFTNRLKPLFTVSFFLLKGKKPKDCLICILKSIFTKNLLLCTEYGKAAASDIYKTLQLGAF